MDTSTTTEQRYQASLQRLRREDARKRADYYSSRFVAFLAAAEEQRVKRDRCTDPVAWRIAETNYVSFDRLANAAWNHYVTAIDLFAENGGDVDEIN